MKHVLLSDIPQEIDKKEYLKTYIYDGSFELEIFYESNFSNTPRLRLFMESLFDIYNLSIKDKNRLVLVTDELNNNAVEHGTGDCGENKMRICIHKKAEKLHIQIEVEDCGEGNAQMMQDMKDKKDATWFEKHHGIRWRGLFLITEKIVDTLYFLDAPEGGLIVGIEKTL